MVISASVGRCGANRPDDVLRVQRALNIVRRGLRIDEIEVDGLAGAQTVGAILDFQRRHMRFADGRIDPNGPTAQALAELVVMSPTARSVHS